MCAHKCACVCSLTQSCPTHCDSLDYSLPGSSRQEYSSGLPFPTPGDLPNAGLEPESLVSPAWHMDSLPLSHLGNPYKAFSRMVITGLILL